MSQPRLNGRGYQTVCSRAHSGADSTHVVVAVRVSVSRNVSREKLTLFATAGPGRRYGELAEAALPSTLTMLNQSRFSPLSLMKVNSSFSPSMSSTDDPGSLNAATKTG